MFPDRSALLSLSHSYPHLPGLNENGKLYSIKYTSFPNAYFAGFGVLTLVTMEITVF
jgi:hypothetical protein